MSPPKTQDAPADTTAVDTTGADTTAIHTPPADTHPADTSTESAPQPIVLGAMRTPVYLPLLAGKRVGMIVNHTSTVGDKHLVDSLLQLGIRVTAIFAPEHGFRGQADAGEKIENGRDPQTNIPLVSLYGKHKEPTAADLANIDILLFDIQDVGVRFYTYISTLHYVMQAAAKHDVPVLVLDRPNPNGHYTDGPVLKPGFTSFVGMHPVPVVHGMTVGEYAKMINGERWLDGGRQAKLTVVPCQNYTHERPYALPLPPSPNLPNIRSIYLYPSICFFEGTPFSEGRGTDTQFQVYGHPDYPLGDHYFTPKSGPGAKSPKLENQRCRGVSFTAESPEVIRARAQLDVSHLITAYQNFPDKGQFFLPTLFIDKLAGSDQLRTQIVAGMTAEQIRASWQPDLERYRAMRRQYLLYE